MSATNHTVIYKTNMYGLVLQDGLFIYRQTTFGINVSCSHVCSETYDIMYFYATIILNFSGDPRICLKALEHFAFLKKFRD